MTESDGVPQNPRFMDGQRGFTPPADSQSPTGNSSHARTHQGGAPQPQSPFGTPQGPLPPGAGRSTSRSRPWFKRKRFAIPGGVLALAVCGALVSPKENTDTTPVAASAAASSSAAAAAASASSAAASSAAADSSAAAASSAAANSSAAAAAAAASSRAAAAAAAATSTASLPPAPAPAPAPNLSVGQENALGKARDYLETSSFSRSGLIRQLEYDGFSASDATGAVDSLNVALLT